MLDKKITAEIEGDNNLVIQGIKDSAITVNLNDNDEVRKLLMDFQEQIAQLPTNILDMLKTEEGVIDETLKGIRLHLSMGLVIPELRPDLRETTFKVAITNFIKTHRFCHQPYFKLSKPVVFMPGTEPADTFTILPHKYSQAEFPSKLEYGQHINADFGVVKNQIEVYRTLDDGESYIQAFCNTTLGELFSSNKYLITDYLKSYDEFMAKW